MIHRALIRHVTLKKQEKKQVDKGDCQTLILCDKGFKGNHQTMSGREDIRLSDMTSNDYQVSVSE